MKQTIPPTEVKDMSCDVFQTLMQNFDEGGMVLQLVRKERGFLDKQGSFEHEGILYMHVKTKAYWSL